MGIEKKTLQVIEKMTRARVEKEFGGRPIVCRGFLYQPKRPKNLDRK